MKVRSDDHPGILTLTEIQVQLALGALSAKNLRDIVHNYECSRFYLPENVVSFLEGYLGRTIHRKNKFYLKADGKDS